MDEKVGILRQFNFLDVSMYQIQLFLVTANEKSFSRAAEMLNLVQPSLSKRISALEETIGVRLFNRETRPITLTREGELLYTSWSGIAREFEMSLERASELQNTNRIVVCVMDSSRMLPAIPISGKMLEDSCPKTLFSWVYASFSQWRSKLIAGDVDVSLIHLWERHKLDGHMDSELVFSCPKLVCMLRTNPLCQKESISYEDLHGQGFIVNLPGVMPSHLEYIRSYCQKHGFEPRIARYAPNAHALIGSLQNDDEVVVCDVMLRDIESPMVKFYELPDTPSGLLAVWRRDNKNKLIRPYIDLLKLCLEENHPSISR